MSVTSPTEDDWKELNRINTMVTEAFPKKFAADPVGTYAEILERRRKEGSQFRFIELDEFFDNMRRHIKRIEFKYLYGEYKGLEKKVISEMSEVLPLIMIDIASIKSRGYPYRDSLYLCVQFLEVIDWIVMRCEYEPEAKRLKNSVALPESGGESAIGAFRQALNESRNEADNTRQQSAVPYHTRDVVLTDVYQRSKLLEQGKTEFGALKGKDYRPSWDFQILNEVMGSAEIIVFPSYNPLDDAYFSRIRPVPMFILGVLDIPYMVADLNRMPPMRFFEHDCFHILDFTSKEPAKRNQQYRTLRDRIEQIEKVHKNVDQQSIYRLWDKNCRSVREQFATLPGKKETKRMAERLLFTILHEPTTFSPAPDPTESHLQNPTIPECTPMLNRLKDPRFLKVVEYRCGNGFYGEPWFRPDQAEEKNDVVDEINATAAWLTGTIKKVCVDYPG